MQNNVNWFSRTVETDENHMSKELRTHYYKANYKICKEAIMKLMNEQKFTLRHGNDEYQELLFSKHNFEIIVTVTTINPIESAIDFKVNSGYKIGMHRPKNLVVEFYRFLDKNLTFKGIGLKA